MSVDSAYDSLHPSFAELGVPATLVQALARATITVPTPVQTAVIPDALAGRDVLGRAATGSGKTLAFGLPILARLAGSASEPRAPRALIVVPTRELAGQVRSALEPMADAIGLRIATVYGGTPYDRQIKRLRAGADVVVATPGRLSDLIRRGACRLDRVEITVLDEADHLCDLGFFPAVSELVAMTPAAGQRMLLSATLDGDVDTLVRRYLSDPVTHDCDPDSGKPDVQHHVIVTGLHDKLECTAALLRAHPRSIVFTRTRHGATDLARDLAALGLSTVDLHGSLTQNARERNLRKFRSGAADVVVATDVAARGIHVDRVGLVVHYDATTERKSYLHRSGRTARAGHSGTVVTMTTARQVASVTRVHRAAGVTALHHNARTTPRPMTAESLRDHGVPAGDPRSDPTRASTSRRSNGSRPVTATRREDRPRDGGSSTRRGGQPSYPRRRDRVTQWSSPAREQQHHARTQRPRSADRARGGANWPSREEPATRVDRLRSSAQPEPRHPSNKPARTPSTGKPGGKPQQQKKQKKARWTAAERRAGSKR